MQFKPTEDFAAANAVKPGSVRSRYCRMGSYFGVKPRKLKNGRLLWPCADAQQPAEQTGGEK